MICEVCHQNQATIHIHESANGSERVLHICEICAREKSGERDIGLNIAGLISRKTNENGQSIPNAHETCQNCGWSLERFRKAGRLGCPACWTAFREVLDDGLPTVHRGTVHFGESPAQSKSAGDVSELEQIAALQKELNLLVRNESYEKAAEIRDRIQFLKTQSSGADHDDRSVDSI